MTELASVDYPNQRVHLHADTMTAGVTIALYQEVFADWLATVAHQNYQMALDAEGYVPKTASKRTARRILLPTGWRIVPYDASHKLQLKIELLNKADVLENIDCFDRSSLSAGTDIDIDTTSIDKVEVVTVNIGGSVSQDTLDAIKVQTDKLTFTGSDVNAVATVDAATVWNHAKGGADAGSYGEALENAETSAAQAVTAIGTLDGKADAILEDTGTTLPTGITAVLSAVATVDGKADAILLDTGTTLPDSIATIASDLGEVKAQTDNLVFSGGRLAATIGADVLIGTITWSKAMRIAASGAGGGKVSGAGTGTESFRDLVDGADEFVVTTDENGNRTGVNLNL